MVEASLSTQMVGVVDALKHAATTTTRDNAEDSNTGTTTLHCPVPLPNLAVVVVGEPCSSSSSSLLPTNDSPVDANGDANVNPTTIHNDATTTDKNCTSNTPQALAQVTSPTTTTTWNDNEYNNNHAVDVETGNAVMLPLSASTITTKSTQSSSRSASTESLALVEAKPQHSSRHNNYYTDNPHPEDPSNTTNAHPPSPPPPHDDCPYHHASEYDHFITTCRFVARIGWYACHYGATPSRVEVFLQDLMQHFGYTGSLFRVTNTELVCIFSRSRYDFDQVQRVYELQEGLHLHRLGLLNQVCKDVLQQQQGRNQPNINWTAQQTQALQALEDITKVPDPWNFGLQALSFVLTGALAPAVFQGSWWDLLGGALCSLPVLILSVALPPLYQKALPLASTFCAAMVAKGLQHVLHADPNRLHVELVVLAAVIIQVPGYGASLAVSELITNHVTGGVGRLVQALVTLGLLVGGYWLAMNLWDIWEDDHDTMIATDDPLADTASLDTGDAIPVLAQALFCAPLLMLCLCIQFQISPPDVPWSFGNLMLAYATSYAATKVSGGKKNLGVLLAAVVVTVYAQAWAKWKDRPRSIVITPALVVLVSGSIGFRGLVSLTVKDESGNRNEAGLEEFGQMFVVALLIMAGVLVGNLILRAPTTL